MDRPFCKDVNLHPHDLSDASLALLPNKPDVVALELQTCGKLLGV